MNTPSVVSTSGPLQQVNVTVNLPTQEGCGNVTCPPGPTLRQKQRLLCAVKKEIHAELYEVYKTLTLQQQFGTVLRHRCEAAGLSPEASAVQAELHRNYAGLRKLGQRMSSILIV